MRKKTMFLGLLGAGLMWMPASAILAAQMNNAAMSVQQNQGIKGTVVDATGETLIGASVKVAEAGIHFKPAPSRPRNRVFFLIIDILFLV